jgi:large subunit ribosomal protein L6
MSRIGKQPVVLPNGVTATVNEGVVTVKGTKGELKQVLHNAVTITIDENAIIVSVKNSNDKKQRAIWGLMRSLIQNMVTGVTEGFSKKLQFNGVGYKVAVNGSKVNMSLGYSHPIEFPLPDGITAEVEKNFLTISGSDKHLVGETAAQIRKLRKPEPYKGKGIKYDTEIIRRKAGKAAKASA